MKRSGLLAPYGFLFPALVLLLVFTVFPLLVGVILSFFNYNLVEPPHFVGLQNFKVLFHDHEARIAFKNSLTYLAIVPVLQILAILLAMLVNNEIKGIRVFRMLFYIPVITSIVVVALAWKWLLADDGLLNGFLHFLHIKPVHWLTNPSIALYSVMLVTLWKGLGYYMVIYLAGLQGIDPQYEEAARLDGANSFQVFRFVVIPFLKPTIAFCSMISCIAAVKVFAEIYVMTEGGPLHSTSTVVYTMYDLFMNRLKLGYASALGMTLALLLGILSYVNYRFFRKGGFEAY